MMIKKIISIQSIVSVLLVVFLLFSCGNKDKSSQIESAMFMNNTEHSGKFNSLSVKTQPHVLWKVKTGDQVISSPVISGDMLYIGSNDKKLYAINSKNWRN